MKINDSYFFLSFSCKRTKETCPRFILCQRTVTTYNKKQAKNEDRLVREECEKNVAT